MGRIGTPLSHLRLSGLDGVHRRNSAAGNNRQPPRLNPKIAMATVPLVRLTLDAPTAHYRPGDQLTGRFMVDGTQPTGRPLGRTFGPVVHGRPRRGRHGGAPFRAACRRADAPPRSARAAALRHVPAAQPAELRRADRESVLVRPRTIVFAARTGIVGRGAVPIGQRRETFAEQASIHPKQTAMRFDMFKTLCAPPSRNSNPFATCWTRPGAIPFRFPDGETARRSSSDWRPTAGGAKSSARTAAANRRCSKRSSRLSTMLAAPYIPSRCATASGGCRGNASDAHAQSHSDGRGNDATLPRPSLKAQGRATHGKLLIIDGYEQLGWLQKVLAEISLLARRNRPAGHVARSDRPADTHHTRARLDACPATCRCAVRAHPLRASRRPT